jgi:hypothetical protein
MKIQKELFSMVQSPDIYQDYFPEKLFFRTVAFFVLTIILNGITVNGNSQTGVRSGSYLQEIKSEITLPEMAGKEVIKFYKASDGIEVITTRGVFKIKDGKWSGKPSGSGWITAADDRSGAIWLASAKVIQRDGDPSTIELPAFAEKDTITCLFPEDEKNLLAGTTKGLLIYNGTWSKVSFTTGKRINSILKDIHGDLWVATGDGLLRRINGKWINLDDNLMAYGLKRSYFALEEGTAKSQVLFGGLFSIGCIAENGDHWLLRGADGLPYGPVTTIKSRGETIWLGTDRGAIKKDQSWHYYFGKRWLPDNRVNDILPLDDRTVWIATPLGISQIQQVEMTLEQKAEQFEKRIQERHDRYGLVSDSRLLKRGDLSSNKTVTNDNDGLWTSIYLASECYRFAVTKDPEAKKNAVRAYEAMERLETITGIPGFPARSFVAANESTGQGGEWHLTKDGKWKWKGDTSSDEIVGHMFAYPLFYDLVAEGEYKTRVKNLVSRIMNHIVDNNFQLIDLDGKPTRWGVWTPDSLNFVTGWWYERGINSLQILSFLKAAYHITSDQKFEKAYERLIKVHHYDTNMIQQKMYGPYDINHSDDELSFLPYYILFRYAAESDPLPVYKSSLERSWKVEQSDRIPVWNIISGVSLKRDCDLKIALEELQLIPMDLVTWTMENSQRWDLPEDQLTDRFGYRQATRPVPTPERGISKWNSNTYLYNSGSDGFSEDDGAFFLLPYWMGRYHGLIISSPTPH